MYTLNNVRKGLADLLRSIEDDLKPILQPTREQGGYFAIPREVCCYVNFLGALYCGWDGKDRRQISTTEKSITFVKDIFGDVDAQYRKHARPFYIMMRHGTVHCYRPHSLKRKDGRILTWVVYKGERKNCPIKYGKKPLIVSHLEPITYDEQNKEDVLPVSMFCLYDDLGKAIEIYLNKVEQEIKSGKQDLLKKYESTVEGLMQPEERDLTW